MSNSIFQRNFFVMISFLLVMMLGCEGRQAEIDFRQAYKLYQDKDFEKALPLFRKAIKQRPNDLNFQLRYANALEDFGKIDEAIEIYIKIIEKNPKHILSIVSLANAYRRQEKYDLAIQTMKTALSLKGGEPWMIDNYANMLEESGDLEGAYKNYHKAVKLDPNDPEFRADLANLCVKLGKKEEAISLFTTLKAEASEMFTILDQQEQAANTEAEKMRFKIEKEPYLKSYNYYYDMLIKLQTPKTE